MNGIRHPKIDNLVSLVLAAALVLTAANCAFLFGPPEVQTGGTGQAVLRIRDLAGARPSGPPAGDDYTVASYDVYGTNLSDSSTFTLTGQTDLTIDLTPLSVGTWNFQVDARNAAGDIFLEGSATNIEISSGATEAVTVYLAPCSGTGDSLDLTVTWPEAALPHIEGALYVLSAGAAPAFYASLSFDEPVSNAGTSQSGAVLASPSAGAYVAEFVIYSDWDGDSGVKIAGVSVSFMVFHGAVSSGIIDLSAADFSQPPAAPTDLAADGLDGTTIRYSWTDNAFTESGYQVSVDGGAWSGIARNAASYDAGGLDPLASHAFAVRAVNDFGVSAEVSISGCLTARGGANVSWSVQVPGDQTIVFAGQAITLAEGKNMAVTATPGGTTTDYKWFVDGKAWISGADADFCLAGANLPPGIHVLSCVVTMGGKLYSKEIRFNVKAAPGAISAGYTHSLWVKADGSLWSFGFNELYGSLGRGDFNETGEMWPYLVREAFLPVSKKIDAYDFNLILDPDGGLFVCGDNSMGQFGLNDAVDRASFTANPAVGPVVDVAGGIAHSVLLRADGTVWTAGDNGDGQLGDSASGSGRSVFGQVPGLSDVIAVAAGDYHTLALRADGTVWAFGRNNSGQLGLGTFDTPIQTATQIPGITDAKAIAAGLYTTYIVLADGTVLATGSNMYGQLANGNYADMATPGLMKDSAGTGVLSNIVTVSGGSGFALALASDGVVYGVGYNFLGQLGQGDWTDRQYPTSILGLPKAFAIDAGDAHSLVLGMDGSLWGFGINDYGEIGYPLGKRAAAARIGLAELPPVGTLETLGWPQTMTLPAVDGARVYRVKVGAGAWIESTNNNVTLPATAIGTYDLLYQAGDGAGFWSPSQTGTVNVPPVVGGPGPGGGIVYYDKGAETDGWRYLEAAPAGTEWSLKVWGGYGTLTGANGTNPGDGSRNTIIITDTFGPAEPYASATDYAARLCADLTTGAVSQFNDWFLPSSDELTYMYQNLHMGGSGGFQTVYYGSSTESAGIPATEVDVVDFNNGDVAAFSKNAVTAVRAARAFRNAVNPLYQVVYRENGADSGEAPFDLMHYAAGETATVLGIGAMVRSGYTLNGWNTKSDGSGTHYTVDDPITILNDNLFLYAQWWPANFMQMVPVNSGTFQMGSATGYPDELPIHNVTLSSFKISKYEVTQAQYAAVMGNNPSYFTGDTSRPVERVTWYDVIEFCNKLSQREGLQTVYTIANRSPASGYPIISATVTMDRIKNGYRLPTEAEWEYAARGGASSAGYTYSGSNTAGDVAWYSGNAGSTTHPVGTMAANELGIHDMSGNVFEWCWDWYGTYTSIAQTDPTGVSSSSGRILRGGGWYATAGDVRSAIRYSNSPDNPFDYLGFRVVALGQPIDPGWTYALTPTPADAAYTSDATPLLDWNDVSSAVGYQIQIADTSVDIGNATTIAISPSQYQYPTSINISDTLYWRVRALDGNGVLGAWSATWSFTVVEPLALLTIPGGSFSMGVTGYYSNEEPIHTVTLDSFKMSKYEVTQAQYQIVMGTSPSYFSGNNLPVEQVSWYDAISFCNTLSILEGFDSVYTIDGTTITPDFAKNGYRLPTEAEWEYAAQGGTSTHGYIYAGSNTIDEIAWYVDNAGPNNHIVGTKMANELGLYDMSGNVWEWCWDWYGSSYYSVSPTSNPLGPSSGVYRINRGGNRTGSAIACRNASRNYTAPSDVSFNIGFRVVRLVE